MLEAAERLFEARGYPATTMEQVADEAGWPSGPGSATSSWFAATACEQLLRD
jgi:hypothetical protein